MAGQQIARAASPARYGRSPRGSPQASPAASAGRGLSSRHAPRSSSSSGTSGRGKTSSRCGQGRRRAAWKRPSGKVERRTTPGSGWSPRAPTLPRSSASAAEAPATHSAWVDSSSPPGSWVRACTPKASSPRRGLRRLKRSRSGWPVVAACGPERSTARPRRFAPAASAAMPASAPPAAPSAAIGPSTRHRPPASRAAEPASSSRPRRSMRRFTRDTVQGNHRSAIFQSPIAREFRGAGKNTRGRDRTADQPGVSGPLYR